MSRKEVHCSDLSIMYVYLSPCMCGQLACHYVLVDNETNFTQIYNAISCSSLLLSVVGGHTCLWKHCKSMMMVILTARS